jgi:hypothetical protein
VWANTGVHPVATDPDLAASYTRDFNETVAQEQAPAPGAPVASASAAVPDVPGFSPPPPGAAGRLPDHPLSAVELAAAIRAFRCELPLMSVLHSVLVRAEWALERQG